VYVLITPLKRVPSHGRRGTEADARGTSVLWVDIDTHDPNVKPIDEVLRTLESLVRPPTMTIQSGRGVHAYWLLHEFAVDGKAVKRRNKQIRDDLAQILPEGALPDYCFDLARVLRVPGTFNLNGDTVRLAYIQALHPDRTYRLEDFPEAADQATESDPNWVAAPLPPDFLSELESLDSRLVQRIPTEIGASPADAPTIQDRSRVDRSRNDYYIACSLSTLGYSEETSLAVLTHPTWFSGAKARQLGNGYDYARKTIQAAFAAAAATTSQWYFD